MKPLLIICASLTILSSLTSCQKAFSGEYIQYGEILDGQSTKRLEQHEIPYRVREGIIYIPEDAFDQAIYCCS
ncbi:hypothetical protein QUF51_13135 [Bacillus pumilus]|nr:hypothetical protein [Bacillus pumilus]